MRLTTIFLTGALLIALTPINAHAAETVAGGSAGGGSVKITGEYTGDGNAIRRKKPANGNGPQRCYTYMSSEIEDKVWAYEVDCDTGATLTGPPSLIATGEPAPPTAADIEAIARNYVRTLAMPVPQPQMSAPEGISGARHSIDLQTPSRQTFPSENTSFGQLSVTANGRFTVNWGDGTSDVYTTSGAPWPNSEIAHSWNVRGQYRIVVTAQWNVDWRLGGYSGVIPAVATSATVPAWNVVEAQAVIVQKPR